MKESLVSVIIPVYNAEKFLSEAVESAINLPEVKEILLIEDNSKDNSLKICKELTEKYPEKIKLYQHKDKKNHGAGASRNIGLKNATGDYIAFLDADDFYLPHRFRETFEIFEKNPDIDGVYGAVGTHFENDEVKKKYGDVLTFKIFNTIWEKVAPENLIETLVKGGKGWLHLDTITIKRDLIKKSGYFNTKMRQGQDTHFAWKLAAAGNLTRQSIEKPVALRRAHEGNRVHNDKEAKYYHTYLVPEFYKWGKKLERVQKIKHLIPQSHINWIKRYAQICHEKNWKYFYTLKLIQSHEVLSLSVIIKELKSIKDMKFQTAPSKTINNLNSWQKICFNNIIDTIKYDYKDKNIYLYGGGIFLELLLKQTKIASLPVCGVFDYDVKKEGKKINNWTIHNPQNMSDFDIDLLLVTVYNIDDVKDYVDSICKADKIYIAKL
ncbi:MAG: glycosyltransferase family 2 protein [Candidatus Gastranaerophilales bacterium]|nr:glycosyltransferase family 2 protein [Candidatus Gastranaerophilales bacterium]